MMVKVDLAGKRFGRLTAKSYKIGSRKVKAKWLCVCDCGNSKMVSTSNLKSGKTKSCGCITSEMAVERNTTHGMRGSRAYKTWSAIINRCRNKNATGYENYGGRGVDVCDDWLKFPAFYRDMGEQPVGHSIERVDVDVGYSKSNCVWIDNSKQAANKRIPKNNKTGVKGVCLYDGKVIAYWTEFGKQTRKSFSVAKYGFSEAFNLACEVRNAAIDSLIEKGGNYGKYK